MTRSHRSAVDGRRGFSLLEIQAAFIVLGFSMAALVPFVVAQLKLVVALERRLPPNATYVLVSKDHGMISLLVAGAGSPTPGSTPGQGTTTNTTAPASSSRAIAIDSVQKNPTGPMDMTASVTVKKPEARET